MICVSADRELYARVRRDLTPGDLQIVYAELRADIERVIKNRGARRTG